MTEGDPIVSLAAGGPSWGGLVLRRPPPSRGRPVPPTWQSVPVSLVRRIPAAGWPSPQVMGLAAGVAATCRTRGEAARMAAGYERLASLALARKLMDEGPIGEREKERMLRASNLPPKYFANPATEMIFAASADRLGKGGVIGGITKAVNKAIAPISKIVNTASSTITSVATTGITALGSMANGVNNAAANGVTGFANQAASLASSPAAVGMVAGALGAPLGIDMSGLQQSTAGQWGPSVAPQPGAQQLSTQTLEIAGLAFVAVFLLMMAMNGRRR